MRMQVSVKYIICLFVVLSLMGGATTHLHAVTNEANIYGKPADFENEQIDSVFLLKESVVTALRISESLTSSNPVFKIDEELILRTGVTDIADAMHRLPGVTLRDYGGAGGMKTVSVRGLGTTHTAVSYDGMPLTDIQTGAIDLSRYTLENVSSLSLTIGDNNDIFIPVKLASSPASLIISTPSIPANQNRSFTAKIKTGSFGYVSPYLYFTQRIKGNSHIGFSGEFIHSKNNYPFKLKNGNATVVERRENSRMNAGHGDIFFKKEWKNSSILDVKVYYYDNDRLLPGPVIYYNANRNKEKLRDRNIFAQGSYLIPFAEKWKLNVGGKFNWSATFYTDYGAIQQDKYKKENYWQREYYATVNLLFSPVRKWSFDYSADYSYNNLNSNLRNDNKPYRNSLLQSLTAKFNNSRLTLIARLIGSVYYDDNKTEKVLKKNYKKLSPSLSMSWKLLREGLLFGRVSYKNIFRLPTFNEAYFKHFGSPDLKPESTDQIDIGLSYQLPFYERLPYISITADGYFNRVKDRIVAVPYNMFVWTITNLSSVYIKGTDITFNGMIDLGKRQQLLLNGVWSYQRAKINVERSNILYGKQVAYIPLNSGSFSVSYENPWLNVVFTGRGSSERYAENSNIPQTRLAGYFEFGATLWREFKIKTHSLEIRLDMMNMFDKQYVIVARYPMPGRSFMASIKFKL